MGTISVCYPFGRSSAGGPLSPGLRQTPAQNPPPSPAPAAHQRPRKARHIAPVTSLGLAKTDYSRGPSAFPNIFKPYQSIQVDPPVLTNSPRLEQLFMTASCEITLQDAVELALENSLDIAVQRYYPWISDDGLLNAKAGNTVSPLPGCRLPLPPPNINPFAFFVQNFDPLIPSSASIADIPRPSTTRSFPAPVRPTLPRSFHTPPNSITSIRKHFRRGRTSP